MAQKGLTKRADDFSKWYHEVIEHAELADYAPVKGCMVILPNGYSIWENIQQKLDLKIKETGHRNCYFPLFIPQSFIEKEAKHVEGFSPELAVVTHAGGKKLEEPLVVRPTSETIIWHMFKKWITSHRDLPVLINQWANIVRWELRTKLFMRTSEFLWQEGHTAHKTEEECEEEVMKMLNVYKDFFVNELAIEPFIGRKTNRNKFPGAVDTFTLEVITQEKKGLQSGTSHNLGQNFSKVFEVTYSDSDGTLKYPYATSWGVSTRLIAAIIAVHGDDKGLVIPPNISEKKAVIIPIWREEAEKENVLRFISENIEQKLTVPYELDKREQYTPGWKFNQWEKRGIPLRIEIGPKDVVANKVVVCNRLTSQKESLDVAGIDKYVSEKLKEIQNTMLLNAKELRDTLTVFIDNKDEIEKITLSDPLYDQGMVKFNLCLNEKCEDEICGNMPASVRCILLEKQAGKCIACGCETDNLVVFGKGY